MNDKWALHFDASYRSIDESTWRQYVVRPGINVNAKESITLSFTYGYFKANPNGFRIDTYAVPEHRTHQQITYRHHAGRLPVRHRIRNEQRWIGTAFLDGTPREFRFQERLRYLLRMDIPLQRAGSWAEPLFFTLYDEVAFRFGHRGSSYFDQNRIYAGLGYRPKPMLAIEAGAFVQRFKPLTDPRFENNLVVLVGVTTSVPIQRLSRIFH